MKLPIGRAGTGRAEERGVPPALRGLVSRVLRSGVLLSSALLAAGLLWGSFVGNGSLFAQPLPPRGAGLASILDAGGPEALCLVGAVILALTPLTRVAISAGLFERSGDRQFTGITVFVLVVLGLTIVVGAFR